MFINENHFNSPQYRTFLQALVILSGFWCENLYLTNFWWSSVPLCAPMAQCVLINWKFSCQCILNLTLRQEQTVQCSLPINPSQNIQVTERTMGKSYHLSEPATDRDISHNSLSMQRGIGCIVFGYNTQHHYWLLLQDPIYTVTLSGKKILQEKRRRRIQKLKL